jgi:hypothetical protein
MENKDKPSPNEKEGRTTEKKGLAQTFSEIRQVVSRSPIEREWEKALLRELRAKDLTTESSRLTGVTLKESVDKFDPRMYSLNYAGEAPFVPVRDPSGEGIVWALSERALSASLHRTPQTKNDQYQRKEEQVEEEIPPLVLGNSPKEKTRSNLDKKSDGSS